MNNYYYGGGWHVHYPNSPIKWLIALVLVGLVSAPFFLMGAWVGLAIAGAFVLIIAVIAFLGAKAAAALILGALAGGLTWLIAPGASGWVGFGVFMCALAAN